jgi:predicted dehydrogenase
MRFGLVGTGSWARGIHLEGLRLAEGATPVAVWGRDPDKVAGLAEAEGLAGFTDVEGFLEVVDAVAFAVPPHVQAPLATRAAAAGKHLLLEKPVATSVADARALEEAVVAAGVASAVFVTAVYTPERRAWLEQLRVDGPQRGASGLFLAAALSTDNPFNTPWRHDKGALWDIGPHVVAGLEGALGPVARVAAAAAGERDLVHLVLAHESGATSSVTLTIAADPRAGRASLTVWSDSGVRELPPSETSPVRAHATAVEELLAAAASGQRHPYDVSDGRRVVELLAEAERLLAP